MGRLKKLLRIIVKYPLRLFNKISFRATVIDSNVHKTAAIQHHADVQFVIFGGGAEFESAKEKAKALPNVMINGLLPQDRVYEVYSLGAAILEMKTAKQKSLPAAENMPSRTPPRKSVQRSMLRRLYLQ